MDAGGVDLVPDLLALAPAEEQADVPQLAEVVAERVGVDPGPRGEQGDVGLAGGGEVEQDARPHLAVNHPRELEPLPRLLRRELR